MKRGPEQSLDETDRSAKKRKIDEALPLSLPQDIWTEIALYLDKQELVSLQLVCSALNEHITKTDLLWQPLLNRLHAMDGSISVVVPLGESAREAFIKGFLLLQKRFKAEVASLREHHDISEEYPNIQNINLQKALSLAELKALNAELNTFNAAIIQSEIEECINLNSRKLSIDSLGLTRIPEALFAAPRYKQFWQNLIYFDCRHNVLQSLPENIGSLQALREFYCIGNQLKSLPESICSLQALKEFECGLNRLQSFPESIGELHLLERLDCSYNQLKSLPENLIVKFGQVWVSNTLWQQIHELKMPILLTAAQGWIPYLEQQRAQAAPTPEELSPSQPVASRGTSAFKS